MRISGCDIQPFRIPFKETVTVSGKRLWYREGFVLILADEDRHLFFGEIAPLPGLDPISLHLCQVELSRIRKYLAGLHLQLEQFDAKQPLLGLISNPAVSKLDHLNGCVLFGLESALLQLYLHHAPQQLPESARFLEIPINGLFIPSDHKDRIGPQLEALQYAGFETVKVKIGRIAAELEVEQIRQLMDFFDGAVTLRLDGNQSLKLAEYTRFYEQLGSLPVEYVEEPLSAGKWMDALKVPWPLALDESLGNFVDQHALDLDGLPTQIRHIILKPSAVQGLHGLFRLLAHSKTKGIQVVLSSSFNTGIGLSSLGLVSHLSPGSHKTAHGLDTLKYLSGDLLTETLSIKKGKLRIPVALLTGETRLNHLFTGEVNSC